jgi:hypothetical protein
LACEGSDHALLVLGAVAHHGRLRPATKWSSLGGHLRAAPAVAVSHGAATLFVAGRHHRLLERTLTSGYHRVETGCFGAPAAATAPNRASSYLACKQRNGAIRVWTNVGTGWEIAQHLTARTLGNPVLAATNSGPVVAAEFTDHRVWVHDSQGWRSLAGAIRQGVAATGLN